MKLRHHSSAFTLIELLAVVSIVLILLSLLFPAISKMRESGHSSACVSNLRQIGAAFQMYASDNNGLFPAPRYRAQEEDVARKNPSGKNWQIEINGYLGKDIKTWSASYANTDRYVFCPKYLPEYKQTKTLQSRVAGGYGMNVNLTDNWTYRFSSMKIVKPATTVLVGDSDDYHLDAEKPGWVTPDKEGLFKSGDPIRHAKMANYLFVDGHVAALTPDDAFDAINPEAASK